MSFQGENAFLCGRTAISNPEKNPWLSSDRLHEGGRREDMPFRDSSPVFSQCSESLAAAVQAAAIGLAHVMSTICDRFKHFGLCRQLNGKTLCKEEERKKHSELQLSPVTELLNSL